MATLANGIESRRAVYYCILARGRRSPLPTERAARDFRGRFIFQASPSSGSAYRECADEPLSSAKKNGRCATALPSRRASVRSHYAKGLRGARWINPSRGWDWLMSSSRWRQGPLPVVGRNCLRVPIAMGLSRHVVGLSASRPFFHARYP